MGEEDIGTPMKWALMCPFWAVSQLVCSIKRHPLLVHHVSRSKISSFLRTHGDLVGGLYHQILLSLQKVLVDPVRPLCSHYGAVVGLHALGWKVSDSMLSLSAASMAWLNQLISSLLPLLSPRQSSGFCTHIFPPTGLTCRPCWMTIRCPMPRWKLMGTKCMGPSWWVSAQGKCLDCNRIRWQFFVRWLVGGLGQSSVEEQVVLHAVGPSCPGVSCEMFSGGRWGERPETHCQTESTILSQRGVHTDSRLGIF